ncbi:MAG: hypothetical protein J2P54_00290 [Bradyrhizobiaceae bacterium]|nr:hypothetical protein [Bradyrhizobiaceae bacterium]
MTMITHDESTTHDELLNWVKVGLERLAADDTVPTMQRLDELLRVGYFCHRTVESLCPALLADIIKAK